MSAAKRSKASSKSKSASNSTFLLFKPRLPALFTARGLQWFAAFLLLVGLGVATYFIWGEIDRLLGTDPNYILTAEKIEITPPPEWIHRDIKQEVFTKHLGSSLNIRDRDLCSRISEAFAVHEWVQKVVKVQKYYPARVTVELIYRRPVAFVELQTDDVESPRGWPIDVNGVLLPAREFTSQQANHFPCILVSEVTLIGTVGTPWDDPRIHDAARIADLLGKRWHDLHLLKIVAVEPRDNIPDKIAPSYELHTTNHAKIWWGRAPGRETINEPTAAAKLARLEAFLKKNWPLPKGTKVQLDLSRKEKP